MVGKEDAPGNPWAPCPPQPGNRKMFCRSVSWSSSRTSAQNSESQDKDCADPNGSLLNDGGLTRRYPVPLTPRSQQNCKARSSLPPLQPLSIARRSLDEWPRPSSDDIGEWTQQPPTPSGNKGGERLKLDLSSIQKNPDKNGGLLKRDKIALFDKECSKVADHIYLGGDAVARNRDILKQNGITHVLNCVGFVSPEYFKADFDYRTLWLQDSPSEDITSILYDVFDYFEVVRDQGGRIFVHCCQGVSRSTSLVIAYLMWREGQSFDDAFQYVKAARGIADPNMGFACQLLQCQKRVHAFPLSPSSLLRMYRMAPHSPYDPLHLVPKMLNDPSPSVLDSRGAFILHLPSALYIWIGKHCENIMERDARAAVGQIVRYEKARGPIQVIKDGEEPAYFWGAFSRFLPLMDKSSKKADVNVKLCPGERKVDSYNVDYEIFQNAIKGGFVPPFASSENEHETQLPARESSWNMFRRKISFGGMKEFGCAPKISLSRVYSDSRMIVHSPSSVYSGSISSDSNSSSQNFSDSSLNFSNLSLHEPKASLQTVSEGTEVLSMTTTPKKCSPIVSPISKKSSPSLAERRGNLSKSLKLPTVNENSPRIKNTSCDSDNIEFVFETKDAKSEKGDSPQISKLMLPHGPTATTDSNHKQVTSIDNCGELGSDLGEGVTSTDSNMILMGLSRDVPVKVAEEDKKADEFLPLLNAL
ncbi:hypothetical protein ACFE04_029159 [Oxalis oulophora]